MQADETLLELVQNQTLDHEAQDLYILVLTSTDVESGETDEMRVSFCPV